MPEYRRFISYFYEYIDGKKQRNAGFAKVELRNGMWRVLLRINAEGLSQSQAQVYGFVREPERLRGILLGEIRPVQQIAEEWAFRADAPIGGEEYRLGDLAGIWVESGDGRRFITGWDDGEIDVERFSTEASGELTGMEDAPDSSGSPLAEETASSVEEEIQAAGEGFPEGLSTQKASDRESGGPEDHRTEAEEPLLPQVSDALETESSEEEKIRAAGTERFGMDDKKQEGRLIEELLQKRAAFQPFADAEMESCVMILPCDIVRLQQENWNVGRSSFLQHGFYQYRHLLLGKNKEGSYILGVPGIRNPQEAYMAQMFGYDRFRESARPGAGQTFGYWCRELKRTL